MGSLQEPPQYLREPRRLFADLAALQQQSHLHYNSALEAYVVTRYDDIVTILDHPEIFSSKPTVPEPPAFIKKQIASKCPMRGTLLGYDNPDHDRLRQSVNSFFVPRKLQRFEPLMERIANELLDDIAPRGKANIKAEFALPMPLKVVSAIAGLDVAEWKWVARSLSLFGGHPEYAPATFDEKLEGIIGLHERIAELIQQRRTDRRDDLISHIWNEREAGNIVMTDFEHLSMIPGLLLAGHETTTNLLSMGLSQLLHNNLWDAISVDDSTRTAAIEELLRYESAITGMKRAVLQPFSIGSTHLQPGDHVFVAYNSGSRDPQYFAGPDKLDPCRKSSTQHLGFGRGIHACLGAPLARLLLNVEMRMLHDRLPDIRLVTEYDKIQYDRVHEGRGIEALWVEWDPVVERKVTKKGQVVERPLIRTRTTVSARTDMVVKNVAPIAKDVLLLTMSAPLDKALPPWTPGSHIDMPVGVKGWRQYSICSDPADSSIWQIAVLREDAGSGGSAIYLHEH